MKKQLLLASLLFGGLTAQAQQATEAELKLKTKFVELKSSSFSTSQANSVLRQSLKLGSDDQMKPVQSFTDQLGFTHEKFQQFHKGIKVEYAKYTVHSKNGLIQRMNGEAYDVKGVNTNPSLTENQALTIAKRFIGAKEYAWEGANSRGLGHDGERPEGELVIVANYLNPSKETAHKPHLAYKFNIYALQPLSRDYVYVDAHTGEVVHKNAIIHHGHGFGHGSEKLATAKSSTKKTSKSALVAGNAATRYSGTRTIEAQSSGGSYRLRDYSRGNGIETYDCNTGTSYTSAVDFTDNDNNWTAAEHANAQKDDAALDAHWGAEMTYDYFMQKFNRNSFDGNGAAIKSYVHYDNAYDNAFWNGSVMTYGDGSGTYFDALTALDVAAHEIGHAICTNTANLVYQNESGAMNEGFSDIWGACVEYYAAPEKSPWLIGEDIERRAGKQGLRSMSDPVSEGQPAAYKDPTWYTGTGDNGGVHYNSGVLNHWFYLLTTGKSGTNTLGVAYSVTGIGIEKAAQIAYRTESVYLSSNSVYADARVAAIQSAEDLYGAGSPEVVATTNAWHAVGIGGRFGEISYCSSQGNSTNDEWIASVVIGGFTNTSAGASGYTDYTSQTVNVATGNTAVTLTPGFAGTAYNEYWKIWIDLNEDGDFGDANELVFDAGAVSKTAVSGAMTIPSSAAGVTTRMRVSMKYNGAQTACEAFSYGEVEDYTVAIGGGTANVAPTANANGPYSGIAGTAISFSSGGSSDSDGSIASYLWDFGGGNTSTSANPSYTFATANTYTVTLTVTDNDGATATDNATVTVSAAPVNEAPTVSITVPSTGTTNVSVSFSSSASDSDGTIASRSWNFGDGNTSTAANPSHTYTAAGTYSVTMTVTDNDGATATDNATIVISDPATGGDCVALPYSESFESGLGDWAQATGDDLNWTRDSGGTPSSGTGPSTGSAGSWYMYVETSGNGTGYPNKGAILEGPCFDLSGASAATFSFDYHMNGSNMGSLVVEASTNGTSWLSVWSVSGSQGTAWNTANIDLAAYAGGNVSLRFVGTSGSGWSSDIAIDNVNVTAGSTGGGSNTDVTLTLTTDNYGSETSWTLKDASGQTVASGSGYGNNQTYTETFNLPAGCYDFTINDSYGDGICCSYGNGSYSVTSGGTTFASGGSFGSSETTNFCVGQSVNMGVTAGAGQSASSVTTAFDKPNFDIVVYPNPVTGGEFSVKVFNAKEAKVSIYNALGQVVLNEELSGDKEVSVSTQGMQTGMYFVKMQNGEHVVVKKLVVK